MEYQKILSIVLTDNISFEDITNKIAFAFNIKLQTYDDLSDLLCDENHVLDIEVYKDIYQEKEILEEEIISILKYNKISWERGIWISADANNGYREIFPKN